MRACSPRRAANSAAHGLITWTGQYGNCGSGCAILRPGSPTGVTADGRIVLRTVFRKTGQHDQRQIDRTVRAQKTCERDHRVLVVESTRGRCDDGLPHPLGPPAGARRRSAVREALAFGKAVYDQRCALGLSVADLAARADITVDDVECIEEGGTEPTIALLRRLAAALDSDVRLAPGHDLGSVWFEPTQPEVIRPADRVQDSTLAEPRLPPCVRLPYHLRDARSCLSTEQRRQFGGTVRVLTQAPATFGEGSCANPAQDPSPWLSHRHLG
jgi:transcriptional regulator with XRE-family HTH domain